MSLWRLEWLRLVRTHRLVAILAVYVFFGLTGPLTARYLSAILTRFGTQGVRIEFPPPVPADGIAQFVSNTSQIGLLVVVMVSASALAFDARREMAVFLRTRVDTPRAIVIPAYTVNAAAAVAGFVLGSLAAWYETAVLLGTLPAWPMLAGIGYGALFLVFAVAAVAAVASLARGVLAASGITLALLLALAILGNMPSIGKWLPTNLAGAIVGLVRDTNPADQLPAAVVTAVLSVALLTLAVRLSARREL
jgi:ABC-2 type transport system permease protein